MSSSILSLPNLGGDNRTIIAYVLVRTERDDPLDTTVFRLLPKADLYLLRCFMALTLFPSDTARIRGTGRSFLDAVTRIATLPQPRVVDSIEPHPHLWQDMHRLPFVVLLVTDDLPRWAVKLAEKRPIVVASQHDDALRTTESLGSFPTRLAGTRDLRELYGALQKLAAATAESGTSESDLCGHLASVAAGDLFEERSRLGFLPGLPLPPTDAGRSGCYLYNRLCNNVDEPRLAAAVPEHSATFFRNAFRWTFSACRLLALVETGAAPPSGVGVTAAELGNVYSSLMGDLAAADKFNLLIHLGQRISRARPLPSLVTVPVARRDIVRGDVPVGMHVKPDQKRWSSVLLRAFRDLGQGHTKARPAKAHAQRVYDRARETALGEDRVLSCASATLAARLGAQPLQVGPRDASVYSEIRNLNNAIETNSRKVSALFRRVEVELGGLVKPDALSEIAAGTAPVTFFSDLPFEWTAVDDWPLCLTKPVARIPLGVTRWDVLGAALERRVTIDSGDPMRVLMLDLIDRRDPIRENTDAFISSSTRLGQHYKYATPRDGAEAASVLGSGGIDIVVLDTHGSYDRSTDTLYVRLPQGMCVLDELMPHGRVPPLWILSACDTSVTGALRGCFVRRLLALGAVCVVATLAPVDAFTASMFVGKLLTAIYSPVERREERDFHTEFFDTQLTTAILYDPLLPLFRKAVRRPELKRKLGFVISEFYAWARTARLGAREFRVGGAVELSSSLRKCGLADLQRAQRVSGAIRPETLLFTAFGAPGRIELV